MTDNKLTKRAGVFRAAGLLIIAAWAGCLVPGGQSHAGAAAAAAESTAASSGPKVVAYYFHVTARCVTCRTIENYAKEAVEQGFARELKEGRLEWKPVNVQLPQNRHYIRDYHLFTRSLVLVTLRDGKQAEWRNLERVWELVRSKADFFRYVQTNVKECLGAH